MDAEIQLDTEKISTNQYLYKILKKSDTNYVAIMWQSLYRPI